MNIKIWIKRLFGLDKTVRCSVCKRPLRGKWAKVGTGPKCLGKAIKDGQKFIKGE